MEYVSKELMKILVKKGYNYPSHKTIYYTYFPAYLNEEMPDLASWHQVIDWLFKQLDRPHSVEIIGLKNKTMEDVGWLEFWYNTLTHELYEIDPQLKEDCFINVSSRIIGVKNEFVLEGFIGMLLNWFSNTTNYHLYIDCGDKNKYYWTINKYKERDWIGGSDNEPFETVQQARHEAIRQVFKLIRE